MKKMIHHLLLGTVLASLPLAAGAQTMAPTIDETVTINFYNYNLATAGYGRDATVTMIEAFEAANPLISVEGVPVSATDMMSRVQADVIAGQSLDVAQIIFSDLDYVISNFGVPSFEQIVPAEEWNAHIGGMFPNGVALGQLSGQTYGLAYVFSTPVLFYNADLFRAAGLNPDMPPRTWEEVAVAAQTIIDYNNAPPGVVAGLFSPYDWMFQAIIRSAGGRVLSEDRTRLMFAEPESVEALTVLREMAQADLFQSNVAGNVIEVMASGQLGMVLSTSVVQAAILRAVGDRFELRAAPMPAFGDRPAVPTNSGSALVIMTQDPVRQRAAWELVQHLTSDYAYTIITRDIGYLPLRQSTIDGEDYLAPWLRENPLSLPNIAQLSRMEPWVPHAGPNYRQISTTMINAAEQAVFGASDDVAGIMADAQRRAQALMPR